MPQSLSKIIMHTVFSTKNRAPYLRDLDVREEMHSILGGKAKALNCNPIIVGGVEDHVHLLTTLSRNTEVSDFVKEVKRSATNWIKEKYDGYSEFHWQAGYGCFSIGQSQVGDVSEYISGQVEHHQKTSFQQEYLSLLRKYEIEYDERYVWD
jgi:REP element-mobilizing transposase RayT